MPFKSQKQERFFHTKAGEAKLGKKPVNEFDQASKGTNVPPSAPTPPPPFKSNRFTDVMKQTPL